MNISVCSESVRPAFGSFPIRAFLMKGKDKGGQFSADSPPTAKHRDVDLSVIQQMIEIRGQLQGRERRAVDAFLLSFAMMQR